jgi:hypothetical protein
MPIPPQETEKIWHGSSDPQKCIPLHHWEHTDWLHHRLVWQMLGLWPQGATEGSAYRPVNHWGQASCHPGPLYQALSEEGLGLGLATLVIDSKRYRCAKSRSKGLLNSFYRQAIRLLIKWLPGLLTLTPTLCFTLLLLALYCPCIVTLPLPACTYYLNDL